MIFSHLVDTNGLNEFLRKLPEFSKQSVVCDNSVLYSLLLKSDPQLPNIFFLFPPMKTLRKTMKNVFYFNLNALSFSRCFNFCLDLGQFQNL